MALHGCYGCRTAKEAGVPHIGSAFPELAEEPAGYEKSSGALRFPVDQPLPPELVEKLIAVQL
jgi:uncharacterized protein YdhG (YjbR/CyaY superfamily)